MHSEDGSVLYHVEAERRTRVKESPLDTCNLAIKDHYRERKDNLRSIKIVASCNHSKNLTSQPEYRRFLSLCDQNAKVHFVGHHVAHAAHAYYTSPFDKTISVTCDGGGIEDESNTTVGMTATVCENGEMKERDAVSIHRSNVGGVWSRVTRYVFKLESGYPHGHQAGSVMALAGIGKTDEFVKEFESMLRDSNLLDQICTHPHGHVKGVSAKDSSVPRHPILSKYRDLIEKDESIGYEIARGLQIATTNVVYDYISAAISKSGKEEFEGICLSGGVALNSVMIGQLEDRLGMRIYVPPIPYDGGLSLGAVQYVMHSLQKKPRVYCDDMSSYLGIEYSHQTQYRTAVSSGKRTFTTTDDEVIDLLIAGNIVAVFNGRAESGRRALGNRSILANPMIKTMKDTVNEKVKHRQWYRPFAPTILEERTKDFFVKSVESPYMTHVVEFREDKKAIVPAVVHLDGTARLQTLRRNMNEWYYDFIKRFESKTGCPILLNTSFNDREPICETPEDAIKCFLGTNIDYLYFPQINLLMTKDDAIALPQQTISKSRLGRRKSFRRCAGERTAASK